MRRLRAIRGFGMLFLVCVFCVAVMAVLAFDNKGGGVGKDQDEETVVDRMIDEVADGAGDFIEQTRQKYLKYSAEFVGEANDAINGAVKDAAEDAIRGFFQSIIPEKSE